MLTHHITLVTGDSIAHRLDTISPEVVSACRALMPHGGKVPGFPAFRVEIAERTIFTIYRGREPLVTCGVGVGRNQVWDTLIETQEHFAPCVVTEPPHGQWLAVVVLPPLANVARNDIAWLADFERCMAAALLQ
jgi:hypothetical protein